LLDRLAATDNIVVLYTGDSPRVVEHVLGATGLGRYFRYFFYGTEVPTRADMVRQAIEKAGETVGREFRGKDIVVIGDSVRDIECGRAFGARTIAVATGIHAKEQLAAAGADFLFPDLKDYRRVLKAIASD